MRTTRGAIGIIGIHTPSASGIARRWYGEFITYRKYRIVSCNVSLACAAQLPVDPLGIGTEANQVSPQDMMNPILYRAVTNDSWNMALNRLYASSGATPDTNSIKNFANAFTSMNASQNESAYYAMLASDEWAKALPQSGLRMTGLRPLAYEVLQVMGQGSLPESSTIPQGPIAADATQSNYPFSPVYASTPAGNAVGVESNTGNLSTNRIMRGRARPMPAWPTISGPLNYYSATDEPTIVPWTAPRTYVACILVPPASTSGSLFYYRLKIDWYIEFFDPVSVLDRITGTQAVLDGSATYQRYYYTPPTTTSAPAVPLDPDSQDDGSSLDSVGTEAPKLVMEK